MTSAGVLKSLCTLHMQCTAAPLWSTVHPVCKHCVLLVFVYTEVRTLRVLGVMTRTLILGITILAIWGNTYHLVLWRITRCLVSSSSYTSHRCLLLWCASSTTSWATILLGIDGLVSYSLPRARAKVPIGHSDPWIWGGHPIQHMRAASYVWRLYYPATAYTAVHGYAPSCTWRVIVTHHIQYMNMSYSSISRYGIHDLIQHLRFWTSQILDIQILDISIWIWRSGGSDSGSGGPDPSGPSGYPENTPFRGQFYSTLAPLDGPNTLCTTPNGGHLGCLLDPRSLAPRVLSPSSWVSYIYLRARA